MVSQRLLDRFVARASEDKFRRWFTTDDARNLADRLADLADLVADPDHVPEVVESDPSDDYLIALARHTTAEVLLTGDHGIRQALENADDIDVASPAELLCILEDTDADVPDADE